MDSLDWNQHGHRRIIRNRLLPGFGHRITVQPRSLQIEVVNMRQFFIFLGLLAISSSTFAGEDGLVKLQSSHSVEATADKLEQALMSKGMTVFARIDHANGAANAGLSLKPTELVIFGNPKVGTPLMNCERSVAIDLPQKMLVWEDDSGQVWVAYNDPEHLKARHGLEGCDEVLKKVSGALGNFAGAATAP